MMQGPDLEVLKEIPGYHAIMKAVLKAQIQLLVEQLAEQVGEEAVVLTASVDDGTLSHLGSETGKVFLDGHDEIKSQFLGFCLNRHQKRKLEEPSPIQQTKRFSSNPTKIPRTDKSASVSMPRVSLSSSIPSSVQSRRSRNAFSINHIAKNLRERSSPVTVKSSHTAVPLHKFPKSDVSTRDEKPFVSPLPTDADSYDAQHTGWDEPADNAGEYRDSEPSMDASSVVVKVEKDTEDEGFVANNTGMRAEGGQMNELDWSSNSYNSSVQSEGEGYDAGNQSNIGSGIDPPLEWQPPRFEDHLPHRKQYSHEDIRSAILAVRSQKMNRFKAGHHYGIPKSTLFRLIDKGGNLKAKSLRMADSDGRVQSLNLNNLDLADRSEGPFSTPPP